MFSPHLSSNPSEGSFAREYCGTLFLLGRDVDSIDMKKTQLLTVLVRVAQDRDEALSLLTITTSPALYYFVISEGRRFIGRDGIYYLLTCSAKDADDIASIGYAVVGVENNN